MLFAAYGLAASIQAHKGRLNEALGFLQIYILTSVLNFFVCILVAITTMWVWRVCQNEMMSYFSVLGRPESCDGNELPLNAISTVACLVIEFFLIMVLVASNALHSKIQDCLENPEDFEVMFDITHEMRNSQLQLDEDEDDISQGGLPRVLSTESGLSNRGRTYINEDTTHAVWSMADVYPSHSQAGIFYLDEDDPEGSEDDDDHVSIPVNVDSPIVSSGGGSEGVLFSHALYTRRRSRSSHLADNIGGPDRMQAGSEEVLLQGMSPTDQTEVRNLSPQGWKDS